MHVAIPCQGGSVILSCNGGGGLPDWFESPDCLVLPYSSSSNPSEYSFTGLTRRLKITTAYHLKPKKKKVYLVNPNKIILPPLHIKLGIMKQFVKALPNDGATFLHLHKVFPHLSDAKI